MNNAALALNIFTIIVGIANIAWVTLKGLPALRRQEARQAHWLALRSQPETREG